MFCFMQIRPDRQTLYWSATWPKEVEQLARQFLYNAYKVSCCNSILLPYSRILFLGCVLFCNSVLAYSFNVCNCDLEYYILLRFLGCMVLVLLSPLFLKLLVIFPVVMIWFVIARFLEVLCPSKNSSYCSMCDCTNVSLSNSLLSWTLHR